MSLYKKLLVVDDDPTTLLLLELAARPLDLEVTKASDVNRAVDAVRSQAYDLVVLDHDLNGVPGFEVLDYLRKPLGGVPVLVFSGHVTDEDRAQYRRRGVTTILEKPLSRDVLGFAMRRALKI
jgi:CheY-like chemotaxis protein